jgi:hypothetical protein
LQVKREFEKAKESIQLIAQANEREIPDFTLKSQNEINEL